MQPDSLDRSTSPGFANYRIVEVFSAAIQQAGLLRRLHHKGRNLSVMHLFIDESGGTDFQHEVLFLAGCACTPELAKAFMKRERERLGKSKILHRAQRETLNEVKGNLITPDHQLAILSRSPADIAVEITYLTRRDFVHAWTLERFGEADLYRRMIEQIVRSLAARDVFVSHVVIDHGRYPRAVQKAMESDLARGRNDRISVLFRRSEEAPGVQVADLFANAAYRKFPGSLLPHETDLGEMDIDAILPRPKPLDLGSETPDWLREKKNGSP